MKNCFQSGERMVSTNFISSSATWGFTFNLPPPEQQTMWFRNFSYITTSILLLCYFTRQAHFDIYFCVIFTLWCFADRTSQYNLSNRPTYCTNYFFYNKFIIFLYMFRALYAQHQEVKIVLYSIATLCRWPSGAPVHRTAIYRVWRYQMLYNTILTSWCWAYSARNM